MPQHRRSILIIVLISLLTFSNAFSNGFVGDDHLIIVNNTFYETWANFPKLFSREYITQGDEAFNLERFSHTGSVAYRPVLSATYFLDYRLWRRVPFGYHLHNVALHVLNAVLVYCLIFELVKSFSIALWGAALFAVHPFKSEAVCAVGYRADVLAAFFFLGAFIFYIRRDQFRGRRRTAAVFLSHAAFFLAVFSKESAVVFIGILMAYDMLIGKESWRGVGRHLYGRYLGYGLITLFYLYVYLLVFRNSTLENLGLMGGDAFTHALAAGNIFVQYIQGFFLPLTVKVLPPLYVPFLQGTGWVMWLGLFVFLTYLLCRRGGAAAFFLVWFLIALLPVSNLVPLISPMAYRFMYLPSVGILAVIAVGMHQAGLRLDKRLRGMPVGAALRWGLVVLCAIATLSLNMAWKNNLVMAAVLVRDFPQSPAGYLHLGIECFRLGDVDKAKAALEKSLALGLSDPRVYYYLGLCYFNDWPRAQGYYEKSIRLFPRYALSYVGLGRIYALSGRYAEAVPYLQKALALAPSYTAYGYLIQSYLQMDRPADAGAVYQQARKTLKEKPQLDSLQRMLAERENFKGAVDIGI